MAREVERLRREIEEGSDRLSSTELRTRIDALTDLILATAPAPGEEQDAGTAGLIAEPDGSR